jgi:hypothetical protein
LKWISISAVGLAPSSYQFKPLPRTFDTESMAHSRGRILLALLLMVTSATFVCVVPAHAESAVELPDAAAAQADEPQSDDAVIYVPIKQGTLQQTPQAQRPRNAAAQRPRGFTGRMSNAGARVGRGVGTAASVPLMQVPGTPVPIWWVLIVLAAIPLARLWRTWTARMFV